MINPSRIRLLVVGRLRKGWVQEGVALYLKRLPGLQVLELRDGGMAREAEAIRAALRPEEQLVVLTEEGQGFDSVAFAERLGYRVKLLGTNAAQRSAVAPNVPAIAEIVPGFDFAVIVGVLASTGTPAAAIERISAEIERIAKTPETIQTLANAGIDAVGSSPADYGRAVLAENERLAAAIDVGAKPAILDHVDVSLFSMFDVKTGDRSTMHHQTGHRLYQTTETINQN